MKKRQKLYYTPEYRFQLIGIVSSEEIYRLAWLINPNIRFPLARAEAMAVFHTHSPDYLHYPVYEARTPEDQAYVRLVANKTEEGILIPQHRHMDYFLQCFEFSGEKLKTLCMNLKRADDIQAAFTLEDLNSNKYQALII